MMYMERTQIYLDRTQRRLLEGLARERRVSLSELIREAIWNFVGRAGTGKKRPPPLSRLVGLYRDEADTAGSTHHDDLYD